MDIVITLLYYSIVWLVFVKLKLLPWTIVSKSLVHFGIFLFYFFQFLLLGQFAPHGNNSFVHKRVLQIAPEYGGIVNEVYVKDGQAVKKGDLLFKIDSTEYELNLRDRIEDKKLAELDLQNARELAPSGAINPTDVKRYELKVKEMDAEISSLEDFVDKTEVRSPVDGVVTNLQLKAGIFILYKSKVMTIVSDEEPILMSYIPQEGARYIGEGDRAFVWLDMYPGMTFNAKVLGVISGSGMSQQKPTGILPNEKSLKSPRSVLVKLEIENVPGYTFYGSAKGRSAVLTEKSFIILELFRGIEGRMRSYVNYFWAL